MQQGVGQRVSSSREASSAWETRSRSVMSRRKMERNTPAALCVCEIDASMGNSSRWRAGPTAGSPTPFSARTRPFRGSGRRAGRGCRESAPGSGCRDWRRWRGPPCRENALRRGVEHHDALLRVDRDDGFRGGLDDVEKRWRVGHRLHGRRSGCAGAGPARVLKDCSTSARAAPQARCIAPNGRLARVPVFVRADGLSGAAALSRPPARPDPPSRWPGRPSGSAS